MIIELDRRFFKSLVWLEIVTVLAGLVAIVPVYLTGRWYQFSNAFDTLVDQRFGARVLPVLVEDGLMAVFGLVVLWMLASTIGLFWFRPWARFGFWLSTLVAFALVALIEGFRPAFTSPLDDILAFANSTVFGAIVIISYARGLGADWFAGLEADLKV